MKQVGALLAREPVQLGAFVLSLVVLWWHPGEVGMAVAINGVGWVQRLLSSPRAAVADAHQAGYQAAVADVASLAPPVGYVVPRDVPPPPVPETPPL